MTNEEKANYISSKYEDWWSIEAPDVEKASYDAAIEMAEWKDQQFKEEKKQWIKKASKCIKDWLLDENVGIRWTESAVKELVNAFKQVMEE